MKQWGLTGTGRGRIAWLPPLIWLLLCLQGGSAAATGTTIPTAATTLHAVEGEPLTYDVSALFAQDNEAPYDVQGLPSGAVFDPLQGLVQWTPDFHQAGTHVVRLRSGSGSEAEEKTLLFQVRNSNRPPQISGRPAAVATVGQTYYFAPATVDPDGGNLRFAARGIPSWADFDPKNGAVSGIPGRQDVGSEEEILITVTDGIETARLPMFTVRVKAPGNEVETELRPADRDTDGDLVADERDGFPYDPTRADWVITSVAKEGGDLYPAGEVSVLYGGSRRFRAVPRAGYYLNDLLVNGESVGLQDGYGFQNVSSHHRIEARFSRIPRGLSRNPLDRGLSGVSRRDGGDSSHNRVDGIPHPELVYQFHITYRDEGLVDDYRVYVDLNGCRYPLSLEQGVLATGARFAFATRLGVASHRFFFVVEDGQGRVRWRFPEEGDLPGPVVGLLPGRNLVGIAAHVNPFGLTVGDLVGDAILYRWLPATAAGADGSFTVMDNFIPVAAGEGYLLRPRPQTTWENFDRYGEIPFAAYELDVTPGWNLVANPYGCNVPLREIAVRVGAAEPLNWPGAVAGGLVADGIYSYRGDDWGGDYSFTAVGSDNAVLVPRVGYWIYIKDPGGESGQDMSLIIPRSGHHHD